MEFQRIRSRHALWWGKSQPLVARLHRLRELARVRSPKDPITAWRCCEYWPRALSNKLNARAFVQHHGCLVPDLYWVGRWVSRIPLDTLPEAYVIKPSVGASCHGVRVLCGGHDLMLGARRTQSELRAELATQPGRFSGWPMIVEEFVGPRGALPLEYKCHLFDDCVGVIEVVRRFGPKSQVNNFYDADWNPFPESFRTHFGKGDEVERPERLDELLRLAGKLGGALGTYMRADFYLTLRGWVFGEFATTPGEGRFFTEFANRHFDQLWREKISGRT